MQKTKTNIDIIKLENAASRLRALAHPMRVAILELINKNGKMNVTQIYTKLKIEQAAASHHLNVLKTRGVILSKREGKNTYYYLKQGAIIKIIDCINKCHG